MTLDEIIFPSNVLFDKEEKLRAGGINFLNHSSKYSQKVILLGFKENIHSEPLIPYINGHLETSNLFFKREFEIGEYLIEKENTNFRKFIYIATKIEEVNEAIEWKIPYIGFNILNSKLQGLNFKELKHIIGYVSHL